MSNGNETPFLDTDTAGTNQADDLKTPEGSFLERLVGDGKKYKSEEEVAKAYVYAVEFIDQLKAQQREHEAEIQSLKETAKLKGDLEKKVEQLEQMTRSEVLAPELVERLVNETLDKRSVAVESKKNKDIAWAKLTEAYGDLPAAKAAVAKYAGGDQKRIDFLNQSVAIDPDNIVNLIKTAVPVTEPKGVDKNVDSGKLPDMDFEKKTEGLTWSMAQKIRKEDPKLYKSMRFQLKLHEEAGKDGFFDN